MFRNALKKFGYCITADEAKELMEQSNKNSDGYIR